MATSALPLEILRNGLTPCYFLSLHCRECGDIRTAIPEVPSDRFHSCPRCHQACEYTLLGEGGTQRELPFWNRIQDSFTMANMIEMHWRAQVTRQQA